jgi:Escherichia/Staphylococcus phage prohead protease
LAQLKAPEHDDWRTTPNRPPIRLLQGVHLIDAAPITEPAYPDTTLALRGLAARLRLDPE